MKCYRRRSRRMRRTFRSFKNGTSIPYLLSLYASAVPLADWSGRIRLEEQYIQGLSRLHDRTLAQDTLQEEYVHQAICLSESS